jgi:uncharacterized DUF497 family protein
MIDAEFERDDQKAIGNVAIHGVTFEATRAALSDAFAVDWLDCRLDYGEERYCRIGMARMARGRLLYVAYTMREGRTRIISARGAEPREHRRYRNENA